MTFLGIPFDPTAHPPRLHNDLAAHDLAAAGLRVHPCDASKRPLTQWSTAASVDATRITDWWERWPDAVPAIDLASAGLLVIDADRHGGPDGVAAFDQLVAVHGLPEGAPVIETARGGRHYVFRNLPDQLGNREGGLAGRGINVRGAGGYIIAPGAILPDGRCWRAAEGSPELAEAYAAGAIPEVPAWIVALIRDKPARPEPPATPSRPPGSREEAYARAAIDDEAAKVAGAAEGGRNNALNAASFAAGQMVAAGWITREECAVVLLAAAAACGLPRGEAMATFGSGFNAGLKQPRGALEDREPPAIMYDPKPRGVIVQEGVIADAETGEVLSQPSTKTVAPLFDPWERYVVPAFPLEIMPPDISHWIEAHARSIGCDASGLAMCTLANFSAALHHKFSLRLMKHGSFYASPRLWVLLVGDPSYKKSPMQRAATQALEGAEIRARDDYDDELAAYLASGGDPKSGPVPPPRHIVGDVTTEKLGEILSRSPRGTLVSRDELAGWIGSMERYSGSGKGASSDRAFWLKSFDGGSFTVDRVGRGELRIRNLSCSILGGIQPDRLAELHGLTSDGLLQRFIPVMLAAPKFREDHDMGDVDLAYAQLTVECLNARPCDLRLDDDAVAAMAALHRHLHDLEQSAKGVANGFQAFVGKMAGLSGSLTLILHMIDDPQARAYIDVGVQTVEKVHRLVTDFILPHSLEFYRTAETVTNGDKLQRLASYILTSGKTRLVASDLTTGVRTMRGMSLSDVNDELSPLIAGGWITPERPGPMATAWIVSPAVAQQFSARAQDEARRKQALGELMNSPRRNKKG